MAKYQILGNKNLKGKIAVAGNKNSVLPIMAACLLTQQNCILENVPAISDVSVMVKLLESCGVSITEIGKGKLRVNAQKIDKIEFSPQLTEQLRASVLLLGPMLARVGEINMGYPGGDIIGRRPLEAHFQVLKALGGKIKTENDKFIVEAPRLRSNEIFLQEASVTATENALMASVCSEGNTTIKRAASEPHVVDLCHFLIKMGAKIKGVGSNVLSVSGVKKLSGATHSIRPDHIEVGTFAILAAVTKSRIEISPIIEEDLAMILLILKEFGVQAEFKKNTLCISGGNLKSVEKVVTDVWPGFPTDLMAPMIELATQARGVTLLHDWMYESRMFFVDKLMSMGAKIAIADPHRVLVYGPSNLRGQRLDTPDIRAGIALVIAALAAEGQSVIEKAELIERGYENIVERLTNLGAVIKKIS